MDSNLERLIIEWHAAVALVAQGKAIFAPLLQKEKELRAQVIGAAFPEGKEGTNTMALPNDWLLKAKLVVVRDIDVAALPAIREALKDRINVDSLIRNKPELALKEYRKLTAEDRTIFDGALVIKPGSPELELISPKETK